MKAFATAKPATRIEPAFDLGSRDGYADAVNGHRRDPAQRFQSWHRRRPVSDFADYERGYVASYEQVRAAQSGGAV